jgi:hypothetical protein
MKIKSVLLKADVLNSNNRIYTMECIRKIEDLCKEDE